MTPRRLSDAAWASLDTLRWAADSRVAKYLLALILIKYVEARQSSSHVSHRKAKLRLHDFLARDAQPIDRRIHEAIRLLDESEPAGKVLRDIDFTNEADIGTPEERDRWLARAIQVLANAHNEVEHLQELFRDTLERFSEGATTFGASHTPASLSELIVKIAAPCSGESICDPFCGTGSLLLQAVRARAGAGGLFAQDSNAEALEICRMNLAIHEVAGSRIDFGDSIRTPQLTDEGRPLTHDVIVTDPPLGRGEWGRDELREDPWQRFRWGLPPKKQWGWAVASHIVSTLNEGGRAVMTAPLGVLFRGGPEGNIRQRMLEDNLVEGVITLPGRVFRRTSVPISLVVFKKSRRDRSTLFIDARAVAPYQSRAIAPGSLDPKRITTAWANRETTPGFSTLASLAQIAANDFSLEAGRYVRVESPSDDVDIPTLRSELDALDDELDKTWMELVSALEENRPAETN